MLLLGKIVCFEKHNRKHGQQSLNWKQCHKLWKELSLQCDLLHKYKSRSIPESKFRREIGSRDQQFASKRLFLLWRLKTHDGVDEPMHDGLYFVAFWSSTEAIFGGWRRQMSEMHLRDVVDVFYGKAVWWKWWWVCGKK